MSSPASVSWKSLSSIFATVAISPWNLLVGGLLIQHLSFWAALVSIVIGYAVLGIIFVCYGGLGMRYREQSASILERVFASRGLRYAIPVMLGLGQIGWAGINFQLGGQSLGALLSLPAFVGIAMYSLLLTAWATLNVKTLGFTKWFVVAASVGLMAWVFAQKLHTTTLEAFVQHQPATTHSIFWGLSIVIASFISFATVSPDFFKDVRARRDILLATICGIILPGALTALLGAFLFFNRADMNLVALLSVGSLAFFPQLFNAVTNTDGTVATVVAGLKLENITRLSHAQAVAVAGGFSLLLALGGIAGHLELWLKFLSLFFPICIGVCFPALVYHEHRHKATYTTNLLIATGASLVLSMLLAIFFPPVVVALCAPIVIFSLSLSYLQLQPNTSAELASTET